MFRIDPRDDSDLMWFFNDAPAEVGRMRSLQSSFEAQMERKARRKAHAPFKLPHDGTVDVGYRCGPIYVGQGDEHAEPSCELDGRAIAAAAREKRIRNALRDVGDEAAKHLELRFRQVLPEHRIPFGCAGMASWMRRGPSAPLQEAVALHRLRGAGALAHLTPTALELYPVDTAARVDNLGRRITRVEQPLEPSEHDIAAQLRREAESLVLRAYNEYRGERMRHATRRAA